MILIQLQPASHWYLRDGRPFHEIAKKDGSDNRPVTLADARKVLAFPSVTNVLGVLAKPTLEAWKIEQGILSALTLPRQPATRSLLFMKPGRFQVADGSSERGRRIYNGVGPR